jgi:predicted DNA-binding transcriptional regulator AlpA
MGCREAAAPPRRQEHDIRASRTKTKPQTIALPQLLTTSQVAVALQVSPTTLCRWRAQGTGPKVVWLSEGVPRYISEDVQEWLEQSAR